MDTPEPVIDLDGCSIGGDQFVHALHELDDAIGVTFRDVSNRSAGLSAEARSLPARLMGEEVIPAVREMGKELELFSPFEVDPGTGKPLTSEAGASQPATGSTTA